MKKVLLLLSLLFFINKGFTQKIKSDEIDKFTDKRIVTTSVHFLNSGLQSNVSIYGKKIIKSDTIYMLVFSISIPSVQSVSERERAIFLFADGDKIELNYGGQIQIEDKVIDYVVFLERKQIEKFTSSPVVSIRFNLTSSYKDIDIKPKNQSIILNVAKLLYN